MDSSDSNMDTLPHNMDSSRTYMDTSTGNMDTSPGTGTGFEHQDTLPKPRKTRQSKEEVESAVLRICTPGYKSPVEIGELMNKTPKYLKNAIIPGLVNSGKLIRLYPNTPNHPNQAYKTADENKI